MTKPAASYARLSNTNDSSEPNTEFQHKRNREFLESLGYSITKEYTEPVGMRSGRFIAKRPAMRELMNDLAQYQSVVFFDFTRFSRSTEFVFEFLRAADKVHIKVFNTSTREQITVDNASEFLKTGTQAIFAEYESRKGSERMKNAYRRAKENGWVSLRRAPLGFKLVGSRENRHLVKDDTFPTIREVFKLLASGYAPWSAAKELRKRGFKARTYNGSPVDFDEYHVWNIVRFIHRYEDLIDQDLMNTALRRIAERRGKRGPATPRAHPPLILNHLLFCSVCGRSWGGTYEKNKRGIFVPRYQHQTHYLCDNSRKVTASKIDNQVFDLLERFGKRVAKTDYLERVYAKQKRAAPKQENLEQRRAMLMRKLSVAKERLISEDIELADYRAFKESIEKELNELAISPAQIPPVSLAEIRTMFQSADEWRTRSKRASAELNTYLRDLFSSITIDRENKLTFVPHPALMPLFRGVKLTAL